MVQSQLYLKDSYINPDYKFILSGMIREYDITKANVNILLSMGAITPEQADYYINLPSQDRKVQMGYLQRDNETIKNALKEGFVKYRQLFFEHNQIEDHQVLSIKKDAIYLIDKIATNTSFDSVTFIPKNVYNSYYRFGHYEFLYYMDQIRDVEILDIKGVSKSAIPLHENYFIDFLKFIFYSAMTESLETVINAMSVFIDDYKNLRLDSGYYRELNSNSQFRFRTNSFLSYTALYLQDESYKHCLDISYNLQILHTIMSYYSTMYFKYQGGFKR